MQGEKKDPNLYQCRAQAYARLGDDKNAACEKKKAQLSELKLSALTKINSRDNVGAIEDLDQALTLDPNDEVALFNRAFAKRNLGDYEGAIHDFTSAIGVNSQAHETFSARGFAKSMMADYQGALEDYNTAINLKPDDAFSFHLRALLYQILGEDKKAEADLHQFKLINDKETIARIEKEGAIEFHNCAIRIMKKDNGDPKAALVYCNEAIRLKKKDPDIYLCRAKVYAMMGDHQRAKADRRHAKILANPVLPVKQHYYFSHKTINPTQIVPSGPKLKFD